jgi:hypothetical protein
MNMKKVNLLQINHMFCCSSYGKIKHCQVKSFIELKPKSSVFQESIVHCSYILRDSAQIVLKNFIKIN